MMLGKLWGLMAATAVAALLAMPASAAPAAPGTGGKPMASHHHRGGCYDYAWQSQEMKDCLAKHASTHKPMMHHHHMTKKPT